MPSSAYYHNYPHSLEQSAVVVSGIDYFEGLEAVLNYYASLPTLEQILDAYAGIKVNKEVFAPEDYAAFSSLQGTYADCLYQGVMKLCNANHFDVKVTLIHEKIDGKYHYDIHIDKNSPDEIHFKLANKSEEDIYNFFTFLESIHNQ